MTRKQKDRLNFYGSVTHVRGHTIIQPECGKTRNLEIVFNAYIVSIKLHQNNKVVLIIRALSFSSSSCDLCFCAYKSAEHVE
jgi:hypothetical protein